MPIYEYLCHKCGETFEVRQRISDPKLTTHDGCGGELERLISQTSFVLKGSGWYKTDYAGKGAPASSSNDGAKKGESAGETAKSTAKSETGKGGTTSSTSSADAG